MRVLAVQSGGTLVLANSAEGTALVAENTRILALAGSTGSVVVNSNGGTVTGVGVKATLGTTYTVAGLDTDITAVNAARANYGADMATFESAINNLQTSSVNLSAAKSRVMDTDYAAESAQLTRNSILQQAGTAMLAQANQLPNSVLTLLRYVESAIRLV
ncbi:MAG: flagellin, partial [Rhodoferax sp.]